MRDTVSLRSLLVPGPHILALQLPTVHHHILRACSHLWTFPPPASHQLLTRWDLMFGQDEKKALIVSREVSDQLHLALLLTLTKPPNSLALAFCHTPNGGNIHHCLCPHRAVTRSDPHRMGLSPLCLG